jgi:hypothetical protein
MTKEERSVLETLDEIVRSDKMRAQLRPIIERVRAELARKSDALMTWEPVPLDTSAIDCRRRSSQVGFSFCVPGPTPALSAIRTVINAW